MREVQREKGIGVREGQREEVGGGKSERKQERERERC